MDFESFFNQLIPLTTEQDHKIMYNQGSSFFPSSTSPTDSNYSAQDNSNNMNSHNFDSDVVVKQESRLLKGNFHFYFIFVCVIFCLNFIRQLFIIMFYNTNKQYTIISVIRLYISFFFPRSLPYIKFTYSSQPD